MASARAHSWLTKLVHDIAQFEGRDPSGLQVSSADDGGICVRSASATAYYPLENWTERFRSHLDAGFFSSGVTSGQPTARADQDQGREAT